MRESKSPQHTFYMRCSTCGNRVSLRLLRSPSLSFQLTWQFVVHTREFGSHGHRYRLYRHSPVPTSFYKSRLTYLRLKNLCEIDVHLNSTKSPSRFIVGRTDSNSCSLLPTCGSNLLNVSAHAPGKYGSSSLDNVGTRRPNFVGLRRPYRNLLHLGPHGALYTGLMTSYNIQ